MKQMLLLAILLAALNYSSAAQTQRCVSARSWQRGAGMIAEQTVRITLSPGRTEYATDVAGSNGARYRLAVSHNPYSNVKMEHWQVSLRKVQKPQGKGGEVLGYNLLLAEEPGPEKHNFPKEDFVGYFYPHDDPPVTIVGGLPLIESHFFYPIRAARHVKIEGFCVTLKVEDFRRNELDGTKVDFLDLAVEFRNACSPAACGDER